MANELYAWSDIQVGEKASRDADGTTQPGNVNVIKKGSTVTQGDLGLDDEQFRQLVESGAVRTLEYPNVPETYQGSPVEYLREQARMAAEGALTGAQTSEENISAILAANSAATGTALPIENFDPEVQAEMDRQAEENQAGGGEAVGTDVGGQQQTEFRKNDDGDLFASEDGGATWRPATEAEKAENS